MTKKTMIFILFFIITIIFYTTINNSQFTYKGNRELTQGKIHQKTESLSKNDIYTAYIDTGGDVLEITNYLYQWYSPVWSDRITNWRQVQYTLKHNKQIYFSKNMLTTPMTLHILNTKNKKGIFLKKGDILEFQFDQTVLDNKFEIGYIYDNTISQSFSIKNNILLITIPKTDNYYFYLLNLTLDPIQLNKKDICFQVKEEAQ